MRNVLFAVLLVSGLCAYGFAQTTNEPVVDLRIFAGRLSTDIPPNGLDDGQIFRYSDNVVVIVNGIKMQAQTVEHWEKYHRLVLNGTVQVDLPGPPTAFLFQRR